MAKSPYARKEWLRKHSTSKEMRWLNNGIDAAVKGVGSGRKSIQAPGSTQEDWSRTALSKGQLRAAIIIGAILPLFGIAGLEGQEPGGAFFLAEFLLFMLPFFLAVLVFMLFNKSTRSGESGESKAESSDSKLYDGPDLTDEAQYTPKPEWMGEMVPINSRSDARMLAPQFLKQAQESAKILQTTTEPAVFFERYDFCVGRLQQLEECKKYGVPVGTTADFAKYRSLSFRDGAVSEIIHRVADKYSVKIESLKTGKAKKNWAEKYSKAFEPYLPYMSNAQWTEFVEVSEELSSLAEKDNMESE